MDTCSFLIQNTISCENSEGRHKYWRSMWELKIPGFVKHFLWKACQNILRTKQNLCKKSILQNPLCPICTREEEYVIHVLWSCPAAVDVWESKNNSLSKWSNFTLSFQPLSKQMVEKLSSQDMELYAILFRQIWARRNLVIFKDKFKRPANVIQKARLLLEEFQIS